MPFHIRNGVSRSVRRVMLAAALLLASPCCVWIAAPPAPASAQKAVKIVGIGATICAQFASEAAQTPASQHTYFAWLQGYLSGIVIARREGIDEGIDLNPADFPLAAQLHFVRDYCLAAPSASFPDAAEALFKELRRRSLDTRSQLPVPQHPTRGLCWQSVSPIKSSLQLRVARE